MKQHAGTHCDTALSFTVIVGGGAIINGRAIVSRRVVVGGREFINDGGGLWVGVVIYARELR